MAAAVETAGTIGRRGFLVWLPAVVWAAAAIATVGAVMLRLADPTPDDPAAPDTFFVPLFVAMIASLSTVGVLLALRRATNPIGWLLLTGGVLMAVSSFGASYIHFSFATGRDLPGAVLIGWLPVVTFAPALVSAGLVTLVFPSGRLPRYGRPILAVILAGLVATTIAGIVRPGPFQSRLAVDNPFGVPALATLVPLVETASNVMLVVGFALAAASMASRFRRARGEERLQLAWFAYVAVVLAIALGVASLQISPISDLAWTASFVAFTALPIAVAIAVLKYRLYGIDTLIDRTLVYVPLLGILGGVYAAGVAFFQRMFIAVTGAQSDAALVMTTLVVAGTFTPVRKGLETAVEHRFRPARQAASAVPPAAVIAGSAGPPDLAAVLDDPRLTARIEEIARRVARETDLVPRTSAEPPPMTSEVPPD
jgi:hypothetical protein